MPQDNAIPSFESLAIDPENYFNNTFIPQLYVDGNELLRKFTPPVIKQFNLTSRDIGKPIGELFDNIRFPGIIENIRQVIRSHTILEKEIQTTDMRWYQMNILPYIVRSTDQTNGVIITFVDITRRIKDLKELEKLISEHQILIDAVSHDIKNPLSSILLALEIMKGDTVLSPDINEGLAIIERSASRIKVMADELVTLRRESCIQNGEAELLNIENIMEDVYITLTKQIQDSGATIKTEIDVSEIHFSRRKLRSVMYNLISNAIKYRSADRPCEILVKVYVENGQTVLQVQDNGIGIPKEKQDLIFTKYYRAHNLVEGTGIGLYLVKEIIRSAGGSIDVKSEQGIGSTFTVHLNKKRIANELFL